MATWLELLDDSRWQQRKNEILRRDGNKCQNRSCKSKLFTSLQVHHFYYFTGRMPWEYPDDMLITLCKYCHEHELQRNKAEWYMLQMLRSKGFLMSDFLAFSVLAETDPNFIATLLKTLRDFQR